MSTRWGVRSAQGSRIGISWDGIEVTGDTGRLINPKVRYETHGGEVGVEDVEVDNSPVTLQPDATTNQQYAVATRHGQVIATVLFPQIEKKWEQPPTPEHLDLDAIRERDANAIPRFLNPNDPQREYDFLQAEMDRRALLAEIDSRNARYGDGELPAGLTVSADQVLLNWRGVNYVRQGDHYAWRLDLGNIIMQVQIQTLRDAADDIVLREDHVGCRACASDATKEAEVWLRARADKLEKGEERGENDA